MATFYTLSIEQSDDWTRETMVALPAQNDLGSLIASLENKLGLEGCVVEIYENDFEDWFSPSDIGDIPRNAVVRVKAKARRPIDMTMQEALRERGSQCLQDCVRDDSPSLEAQALSAVALQQGSESDFRESPLIEGGADENLDAADRAIAAAAASARVPTSVGSDASMLVLEIICGSRLPAKDFSLCRGSGIGAIITRSRCES
eukprot:SAG11_NODE_874_length_6773_cov_4.639114_1_plen_203_part_00